MFHTKIKHLPQTLYTTQNNTFKGIQALFAYPYTALPANQLFFTYWY